MLAKLLYYNPNPMLPVSSVDRRGKNSANGELVWPRTVRYRQHTGSSKLLGVSYTLPMSGQQMVPPVRIRCWRRTRRSCWKTMSNWFWEDRRFVLLLVKKVEGKELVSSTTKTNERSNCLESINIYLMEFLYN